MKNFIQLVQYFTILTFNLKIYNLLTIFAPFINFNFSIDLMKIWKFLNNLKIFFNCFLHRRSNLIISYFFSDF